MSRRNYPLAAAHRLRHAKRACISAATSFEPFLVPFWNWSASRGYVLLCRTTIVLTMWQTRVIRVWQGQTWTKITENSTVSIAACWETQFSKTVSRCHCPGHQLADHRENLTEHIYWNNAKSRNAGTQFTLRFLAFYVLQTKTHHDSHKIVDANIRICENRAQRFIPPGVTVKSDQKCNPCCGDGRSRAQWEKITLYGERFQMRQVRENRRLVPLPRQSARLEAQVSKTMFTVSLSRTLMCRSSRDPHVISRNAGSQFHV